MDFTYYLLLEYGFPNHTLQNKVPSGAEINSLVPKDMLSQHVAMFILLPDVHVIPPYTEQPLEKNHVKDLKSMYPGLVLSTNRLTQIEMDAPNFPFCTKGLQFSLF